MTGSSKPVIWTVNIFNRTNRYSIAEGAKIRKYQ